MVVGLSLCGIGSTLLCLFVSMEFAAGGRTRRRLAVGQRVAEASRGHARTRYMPVL